MKIFKESKEVKKSWSIRLVGGEKTRLIAVDSKSGEECATLVVLNANGEIYCCVSAKEAFESGGYDPYEYKNKFCKKGAIVISKQKEWDLL